MVICQRYYLPLINLRVLLEDRLCSICQFTCTPTLNGGGSQENAPRGKLLHIEKQPVLIFSKPFIWSTGKKQVFCKLKVNLLPLNWGVIYFRLEKANLFSHLLRVLPF